MAFLLFRQSESCAKNCPFGLDWLSDGVDDQFPVRACGCKAVVRKTKPKCCIIRYVLFYDNEDTTCTAVCQDCAFIRLESMASNKWWAKWTHHDAVIDHIFDFEDGSDLPFDLNPRHQTKVKYGHINWGVRFNRFWGGRENPPSEWKCFSCSKLLYTVVSNCEECAEWKDCQDESPDSPTPTEPNEDLLDCSPADMYHMDIEFNMPTHECISPVPDVAVYHVLEVNIPEKASDVYKEKFIYVPIEDDNNAFDVSSCEEYDMSDDDDNILLLV